MHINRFTRGPILWAALAGILLPSTASAKVIGMNVRAKWVTRQRILAIVPKKEQAAWLAYLARSEKQQAIDKQTLKEQAKAAGIKTPAYAPHGFDFVLAMKHPAAWYSSPQALRIAHNIVTYQVPDGGWSKNINMAAGPRKPGNRYDTNNLDRYGKPGGFDEPLDPNWSYIATLDNNATWNQIRFLAHVTTVLLAEHKDAEAAPFRASVERGVEYLLNAQYPHGGWPQVWPLEGTYHDAITLNDDAMIHAVEILHDVAIGAPDYKFLPESLVKRAGPAANRGIACLLKIQIVEHGKKTAWADQYDALRLTPTSARNYEMPALTSSESASIVDFLMSLKHPTPAEVASVHDAAAWFKKVEIDGYRWGTGNFFADRRSPQGIMLEKDPGAGPMWSRFYQIPTNLPIFGDRNKTINNNVNEISRERRDGYAWYNKAGIPMLAEYATWAKSHPEPEPK